MANEIAPDGHVFVCMVCGKISKDKYGDRAISSGWDESCVINSVLMPEDKLVIRNNRVVKVLSDHDKHVRDSMKKNKELFKRLASK